MSKRAMLKLSRENESLRAENALLTHALLAWLHDVREMSPLLDFKGPYTTATDKLIKLAIEREHQ